MITRDATQTEEEILNTLTNHLLWEDEKSTGRRGCRLDKATYEIAGVEIEWEWTTAFTTIKTETWVAILGMHSSGLTRPAKRTISYKDEDRLAVDLISLKLALV